MTTQTTFEYYQDLTFKSVNEILGNLCCDLTHWDKLAKVYQEEGYINGADLEYDHPEAYECWEKVQDYIYEMLLDQGHICEGFIDEFEIESLELDDYIDDAIEVDLASYLEICA